MSSKAQAAITILIADMGVLYGIFGEIASSRYFPPREFLNQFLALGHDPCDQDGRMGRWEPLELDTQEYLEVKSWWMASHPDATETALGAADWDEWVQEILNP